MRVAIISVLVFILFFIIGSSLPLAETAPEPVKPAPVKPVDTPDMSPLDWSFDDEEGCEC